MNNELIFLLFNFITAAIVLYYPFKGWNRGGLYMVINVVRLFGSFYLTQYLSNYLTNFFIKNQTIKDSLINFLLNNESKINQIPGASYLFIGKTLENTVESQAWWLIYMLTFILVFIILMIIFSYFLKLAFKFNKIPVLGFFNRIIGAFLGIIFGLVNTLIIIYIFCFLLNLFRQNSLEQILISSWLPVLFRTIF